MSLLTPPAPPGSPPAIAPYRLSAAEFFKMIEADVIPEGRRVWLWRGQLVESMAKKRSHATAQSKLLGALFPRVPVGWHVATENPIELWADTVPLPDLAILRGVPDDYNRKHPEGDDAGLVVEVADTSLSKDLNAMAESYAAGGVPRYWVLDVRGRRLIRHHDPRMGAGRAWYADVRSLTENESVPLILDDREIASIPVLELLPASASRP